MDDRTGLEHRLQREARRMLSQHRLLSALEQRAKRALTEREGPDACSALGQYSEAIAAHFALEDRFFFPALHGLHPELMGDLDRLVSEHGRLADSLGRIQRLADGGDLVGAQSAFERFAITLHVHEGREEEVPRSRVEALLAGADGADPPGEQGGP
jgi:hypothetical protein